MPLLNVSQLETLKGSSRVCTSCGAVIVKDYCRQDDEFFERGHTSDCMLRKHEDEHSLHRTYREVHAPYNIRQLASWEVIRD